MWLVQFYSSLPLSSSLPLHLSLHCFFLLRAFTHLLFCSSSAVHLTSSTSVPISSRLSLPVLTAWHRFQGCCAIDCCHTVKYFKRAFQWLRVKGLEKHGQSVCVLGEGALQLLLTNRLLNRRKGTHVHTCHLQRNMYIHTYTHANPPMDPGAQTYANVTGGSVSGCLCVIFGPGLGHAVNEWVKQELKWSVQTVQLCHAAKTPSSACHLNRYLIRWHVT